MHRQDWDTIPHRRFNPLTGEWVLVSPQRSLRPWSGEVEPPDVSVVPPYDPGCYLCPENERAEGLVNPKYTTTYVFENDFAALLPDDGVSTGEGDADQLLRRERETGICRVICYSPRHDLTMVRMNQLQLEQIIETWRREYHSLGLLETINHVQIFENRGAKMGCSNLHPHGQIWANSTVPAIPAAESAQQFHYTRRNNACLLCSYLERELQEGERILFVNTSFVALVPFWAVWPFETMIVPRAHHGSITSMTPAEIKDLATIMKRLAVCYDNLFQTSFPYSMGIHQQPSDGREHDTWHYHIHYLPPLLRSQAVKKHMVGYELLAMPQRDLTAEKAAQRLRELPETHYLEEDGRC